MGGNNSTIKYTTKGGSRVKTPKEVNPYSELGLSQNASHQEMKYAFKQRANNPCRQARVMASLAYHILSTTNEGRYKKRGPVYSIENFDQFVLAATGYTEIITKRMIEFDLTKTDEHGRTSLYIAARSGFYDTTKELLEAGAPVNQKQKDKSTPLHGAAFYGQVPVVKLLLSCGADPGIKNIWGATPNDETEMNEIKELFINYKEDNIAQLTQKLISSGLATKMVEIRYKEEVIARKIVRSCKHVGSDADMDDIIKSWVPSWHGTKYRNVQSIFQLGLLPSGSQINNDGDIITPPSNHFKLGEDYFGIPNWAAAIFVSPSLLYAAHSCYSERIISNREQWCVVVRARVKPNEYNEYRPTTSAPELPLLDDEPEYSEFRIETSDEDTILRIEKSRNVVVTSTVFIKHSFLERITESKELTYLSLQKLFGTD